MKIAVIPDTQCKPGAPEDHLTWIGQYILEHKPDVIVHLGDHADMPSLSSYDEGKKSFEGRRYVEDIDASNRGMDKLLGPIRKYNKKRALWKAKQYRPRMVLTNGNHEARITRAIENDAKLDGVIGLQDLDYERWGWEVYPFLEVVEIAGIHFSHYFANPMSGKALGGMVETRLKTLGFSFVQGHQQGKKVGSLERNNGDIHRGVIAGSCYLHDEEYKGPQGNGHWRGMLMLHEVCGGNFDLSEVSLDYLCRHYEGFHIYELMERKYPEIFENSQWLKREKRRWGN